MMVWMYDIGGGVLYYIIFAVMETFIKGAIASNGHCRDDGWQILGLNQIQMAVPLI